MATTPNLGLELTAASETSKLFSAYRNGMSDNNVASNLYKIDSAIGYINNSTPLSSNSNILTVGKYGAKYKNINDAIDYAKTYCTPTNRVLIVIGPGIWEENIELLPNPGIDFIGSGKQSTIVQYTTTWPDSTIHITGGGFCKDMCFKATGTSYALHMDAQDTPTAQGEITFDNCRFIADHNAAVGVGLGQNIDLRFSNCRIESATSPAIYAHNLPTAATGQFLRVYDCELATYGSGQKPVAIDNAFARAGGTGTSEMYVSFAGTHARIPSFDYRPDNSSTLHFLKTHEVGGDNILLLDDSVNCNIRGLDYEKSLVELGGLFYVSVDKWCTVPYKDADVYDWTLISAYTESGTNITAQSAIGTITARYVEVITTEATVANKGINVVLQGTSKY